MPRSRASGCAIWRVGAASAQCRAAAQPRTERALRDGRATPRLQASPPLSRRDPERPAHAPETAISWHQPSSPIAVKFHRCRFVRFKIGACWTVQQALDEQGIEYENVIEPTYPRGKRADVIEHTGQHYLPAIEFADGTWYREESKAMAATIRAGRLQEKSGFALIP